MNTGSHVFSQLVKFLPEKEFAKIVKRYEGDKWAKTLSCWNQLLSYGQLAGCDSLRELICVTAAHSKKSFHLGFGTGPIARSTLEYANAHRNYKIFEEFAYLMIDLAQSKRIDREFVINGKFYAFDSTTIDLCLSLYEWARFRKAKGGIKVHTLYDVVTQIPVYIHITEAKVHDVKAMDEIPYEPYAFYIFDRGYNDFKRLHNIHSIGAYFVVRGKGNNDFKQMRWKRRFPKDSGILSDAIGYMNGELTRQHYPDKIRRIIYWDKENKRKFVFFTNALDISPVTVAELYHQRWQIELFFKWLKQHLKIKKFWGTTENAVRIQIYSAITAYCMMAIVQKKMEVKRSIYEMLQIVSISLTDITPLQDLFALPNDNIVNELNGSTEPTLF